MTGKIICIIQQIVEDFKSLGHVDLVFHSIIEMPTKIYKNLPMFTVGTISWSFLKGTGLMKLTAFLY